MCTHRANLAVLQREWPDLQRDWIVRVPASSANLGPAFDAVAIALDRHLEVTDRGVPAPETHPAVRAFRQSEGEGPLSVRVVPRWARPRVLRCRVAGLLAAVAQRGNDPRLRQVLRDASELERHADNAAASVYGGIVAVAAGVVRIPLAVPAVVVWILTARRRPSAPAGCCRNTFLRRRVFNVAHTALLVAFAAGDAGALRPTEDRLHQDRRLARPHSPRRWTPRCVPAWGAWLSGSGPSVLRSPAQRPRHCRRAPHDQRAHLLAIDEGCDGS
jgi:homoserine kinase